MLSKSSYSQTNPSCCQISSIRSFTELANDIAFVITHEEPLPFVFQNQKGKSISFPTKNNKEGLGYFIEGKKGSQKWIFVFQEWWGLNDYIKKQTDLLHESFPDANILALDLYDGKIANSREEAAGLMQSASAERIEDIIKGAADFSGKNSKIGTIGWCFGGAWSNKAAVILGKKVSACVMYYGMPVTDENQIKEISCPVLGIFADKDGWITPKVVGNFKSSMTNVGKSLETYSYDADHAFANPSNPKFNKTFSDEAWGKSIAFFKKNL